MFSRYLIVNLVFSHLGFWGGNFFLIAPFPDHCLLEQTKNAYVMDGFTLTTFPGKAQT